MNVLLLHAEDDFSRLGSGKWDLVVDCGRAPACVYAEWSRGAGCEVISLYDFAGGMSDLLATRDLLRLGLGVMEDVSGIDWWDVLSVMIASNLREIMLIERLAQKVGEGCDIFSSRPNPQALALQAMVRGGLTILDHGSQSMLARVRHYGDVVTRLTAAQIFQIVQDKFDPEHKVRRRLAKPGRSSRQAVTLLPSAYSNVSRTALAYAVLLPDDEFLVVLARRIGKVESSLPNVRQTSLDGYFPETDQRELTAVLERWDFLKSKLLASSPQFRVSDAMGLLDRIPQLIPWGLAIKNAWGNVLRSENVTACLCADDSNPYTRIPLLLAKQAGMPALACHHGALDSWMAIKRPHADHYLAKSQMERDYLIRQCQTDPGKIVIGGPSGPPRASGPRKNAGGKRPWLVYFTEPYGLIGWRPEKVYQELVPALVALANRRGLKLIFKLHPFENVKEHRRMIKRYLSAREFRNIGAIGGTVSEDLWAKTEFAITVQSTVALECTEREIPVYLCRWLRDSYCGYGEQFEKFGIGVGLNSILDLETIPESHDGVRSTPGNHEYRNQQIEPAKLHDMLRSNARLTPLSALTLSSLARDIV